MQPFDLDKVEQAERQAGLQRWQLQRAMQVFQMRRDPNGSLLGILVELGYLEREFALRLRNAPAAPAAQPPAPSNSPTMSSGDGADFISPSMPSPSSSGSGDWDDANPTLNMKADDLARVLNRGRSTEVVGGPSVTGSTHPGLAPNPTASTAPGARMPGVMDSTVPSQLPGVMDSTAPGKTGGSSSRAVDSRKAFPDGQPGEGNGHGTFGRYELKGVVARGGMGTVYRAVIPELEKTVALKTLTRNRDEVDLKRFLQEARSAARLRHPNIVPVHDIGEIDGVHYFTMDLIDGDSLDELVHRQGTFSADEAARLGARLSRALDYAHRQGVIHRDIKPGNVIIERATGEAYLTDFGLARTVESSTQLTKTGFAVGTPNYMSPEQASGARDIDARADIYGIATLIYAIVTGRPPFDGPNALATMTSVINDPVPSLRAHAPEAPEALDRVLKRALAKRRRDRYQTAAEFADALAESVGPKSLASPESRAPLSTAHIAVGAVAAMLVLLALAGGVIYHRHRRGLLADAVSSARTAVNRKQLAAAKIYLSQAEAIDRDAPELAEVRRLLGEAEQAERDREAAEQKALEEKRLAEARKRRIVTARAKVQEHLDRAESGPALAALDAALERDPEVSSLRRLKVRALLDAGRFDDARALVSSLRTEAPDDVALLLLEAVTHVEGGGERTPKRLLAEAADKAADHPLLHYLRARLATTVDKEKEKSVALTRKALVAARAGSDGWLTRKAEVLEIDALRLAMEWSEVARLGANLRGRRLTAAERVIVSLATIYARYNNRPASAGELDQLVADIRTTARELEPQDERRASLTMMILGLGRTEAARELARSMAGANEAVSIGLLGRIDHFEGRRSTQRDPNRAKTLVETGIARMSKSLSLGWKSPTLAVELGSALEFLNRTEEALQSYRRARLFESGYLIALQREFNLLRRLNRDVDAIEVGEELVRGRENDFANLIVLSEICSRSSRPADGLKYAELACRAGPRRPEGWLAKARALKELKRVDEAREALRKGLVVLPRTIGGYALAADRLLAMKLEVATAWKYVDSAFSVPATRENWKIYQRIGRLCEQYRQWARALRAYDALAKVYPTWEQNLHSRAIVQVRLGRMNDAIRTLASINAAKPDSESAFAALGLIYYAAGRLPEADAQFAKVRGHASRLLSIAIQALIVKRLSKPAEPIKARIAELERQGSEARAYAIVSRYLLGDVDRETCQGTLKQLQDSGGLRTGITAQLRFIDALDKLEKEPKTGIAALITSSRDTTLDGYLQAVAEYMARTAQRAGKPGE